VNNYISRQVAKVNRLLFNREVEVLNCESLDLLVHSSLNKIEFLRHVDARKHRIHEAFAARYSPAYAKLMTLKIVNLLVGKYHFINKHTTIASRPIQLMIDPANACQLTCPGCVHTSNPAWAAQAVIHWPNGMLSLDQYEKVLKLYGPFAFGAVLYNYGEPLLNPLTPQFISLARQYLLFTLLSTNLSLPKIDADAIVNSGLNHMIISIDGVTQRTYEQYRRGGKLQLVFENIGKIVDAKKRLGRKTPYLVWQFLTFEHNVHEVDAALIMAKQIGVDAVQVLTPFDVSADDPTCRITTSPKEGYHFFTPWDTRVYDMSPANNDVADGPEIDRLLHESLVERMTAIGNVDEESRSGSATCGWLYKSISVDGLGRVLPCCISPSYNRHLVFGDLQDIRNDYWNSTDFIRSRLALTDRQAFSQNPPEPISYCAYCPTLPEITHGLWRIAEDLPVLDKHGVISTSTTSWLTNWS